MTEDVLVATWAPPTQVEGQSVGQLVLTLHQSLSQLHVTSLPAHTHSQTRPDQRPS